jgi:hypothetical protein
LFVFGLVPILGVELAKNVRDWFPGITGDHVFAGGLAAWGLFSLWYFSADSIRGPANLRSFSWKTSGEYSPFQYLLKVDEIRPEPDSRSTAIYQYLFGCASRRLFVVNGIWIAALFMLMSALGAERRVRGPGQLMYVLPFLGFFCTAIGFTTARRARLLWLRAGVDRAGLFALASRLGLQAALTTWAVVAGAVGLFAIAGSPAHAPVILLFLAAQTAVATCMFYGGLAMVRDWSAREVLLVIGLMILFLLQMSLFWPYKIASVIAPWTTMLVLASALAIMFRWYAQRRWRALDWRLIKVGKLDWRQR